MSLNLDKTDLKDGILIITNDDSSITCIPEESATTEELLLFEEFRQAFPNGKPVIVSLEEAKATKIKQLSDKCNQVIFYEFYSDADGESRNYGLEYENQIRIESIANDLKFLKIANEPLPDVSYYPQSGSCKTYTGEQFLKLASDAKMWVYRNVNKYKDVLKPLVETCNTIEEVEAITWATELPIV